MTLNITKLHASECPCHNDCMKALENPTLKYFLNNIYSDIGITSPAHILHMYLFQSINRFLDLPLHQRNVFQGVIFFFCHIVLLIGSFLWPPDLNHELLVSNSAPNFSLAASLQLQHQLVKL